MLVLPCFSGAVAGVAAAAAAAADRIRKLLSEVAPASPDRARNIARPWEINASALYDSLDSLVQSRIAAKKFVQRTYRDSCERPNVFVAAVDDFATQTEPRTGRVVEHV